MTEYRLPDDRTRLVSAQLVLTVDDTCEVDAATADEYGLVPVEADDEHVCDECGESFDSARGLANHERTHDNESDT